MSFETVAYVELWKHPQPIDELTNQVVPVIYFFPAPTEKLHNSSNFYSSCFDMSEFQAYD